MIKLAALLLALICSPAMANYTLTVSTSGPQSASVIYSSNPTTGINCGSTNTACSVSFPSSSTVLLTQVTGSTAVFAGWGGAQGCGSNLNTCKVVMNASANVTATYNAVLAVSLGGQGLGVVSSTTGVSCTGINDGCSEGAVQTYSFPYNFKLVLNEVPNSSSTFAGWVGHAGCSSASTCTVTMSGYETVVSSFSSAGPFQLTVINNGGGSVTSSPAGISCPPTCSASFTSGTSVALSTAAAAGYYFAGWANGGCSGQSPCVIKVNSAQQALGGSFSPWAFFLSQ